MRPAVPSRCGVVRLGAGPLDLLASLGASRGAMALTGPSWTKRGTILVGLFPRAILVTRGTRAVLHTSTIRGSRIRRRHGSPLRALSAWLDVVPDPRIRASACGPGWYGYLAYDLGRSIERMPGLALDDLRLPDVHLALHDTLLEIAPGSGRGTLRAWRLGTGGSRRSLDRAWEEARACIEGARPLQPPRAAVAPRTLGVPRVRGTGARKPPRRSLPASTFTRERYLDAVRRVRRHIREGDVYQVNLSQRFRTPWPGAWQSFAAPALDGTAVPYAGVFRCGDHDVVSLSPERFLGVRGRRVVTRPIKGTRPRGRTPEEDQALRQELLASEKDLAELHMIVDLERNDLGRVSEIGSVRVRCSDRLETYPHVHHLAAEIEGRLRRDAGVAELLEATFPGGSITGCPKIRAMEIIEGLEPVRRHVYTGAVGWIGMRGEVELAVAIRTATLRAGEAFYGAGGGIVIDSSPEREYEETLHKGRAFFELVGARV